MITSSFLTAFLAAQGLFALNLAIPGSNFVLISRTSLTRGRTAGWAVSLGASMGDMLFAALALGGLAAVAARLPVLLQLVALGGGLWLFWMGLRMVIGAKAMSLQQEESAHTDGWTFGKGLRLGLSATLINPQTVLFFSAIVAAGSSASTAMTLGQDGLMWAGFATVSLALRGAIAWLFATGPARRLYARMRLPMNYVSGSALAVFGGKTALHTLPFWAAKAHVMVVAVAAAV